MIRIPCPWCGRRDAAEFAYVGTVSPRPDPRTTTPEEWHRYLYVHPNPAGQTIERWYHRYGCERFLTVQRDTTTNEVRSASDAAGLRGEA
ncbi:MAG: sarcosine oxidase subunit delta [Nocardioidaceae bacterium]